MRSSFILGIAALLIMGAGCGISKLSRLSSCEFRVTTLESARLSGIDIQGIRSFKDLRITDAPKLLDAFTKGALPLTFTLNLEVKNPNSKPAAMGRLDWEAFIDDVSIASGEMTKHVDIPAGGGVVQVPVVVQADIFQLLKGKEKDAILNFAFNLVGAGNKPTRAGIKIKPYIRIGKKSIPYPGFFRVSETFGAK